jgi:hypothetical protein
VGRGEKLEADYGFRCGADCQRCVSETVRHTRGVPSGEAAADGEGTVEHFMARHVCDVDGCSGIRVLSGAWLTCNRCGLRGQKRRRSQKRAQQ